MITGMIQSQIILDGTTIWEHKEFIMGGAMWSLTVLRDTMTIHSSKEFVIIEVYVGAVRNGLDPTTDGDCSISAYFAYK